MSSSTKKIKPENEWGVLSSEIIEVQTISLSDLLAKFPVIIDLIVLDLQGGELDALNGPKLIRYPRFLIVEVTDTPSYEEGASSHEISEKLRLLGYKELKVVKSGIHGHGEALFIFEPKLAELAIQTFLRLISTLFLFGKQAKKLYLAHTRR